MAEVTWFKVLTDIFADDKIKIIQSMPEGDSLLVTWFKVLSQAGKTNDGGYIYLRKNIPYTPAMLATLFNKPQMIVELALKTFEQFEMIDIDENGYLFVTNWEKHQSIDKLNLIKEQTRLRVQGHREKKKQELLTSNATVTLPSQPSNAIDLELDLDLELEKEKPLKDTTTTPPNPFALYQSEGFGMLTETIGQKIGDMMDDFGEPWVCEAMKEASYYGKRNLPYVKSILNRYRTSGIDEPWKQAKAGDNSGGSQESVRHGRDAGNDKPYESGKSGILPSKYLKVDEHGNLQVSGL